MKESYSFLNDESARQEIRKHKWIESEKRGVEIGFATAALDWITKYGQLWRESRQQNTEAYSWKEKRQYRRFNRRLPLQLSFGKSRIKCYTDNINYQGVACTVEDDISADELAQVTLHLNKNGLFQTRETFQFQSHVARVTRPADQESKKRYKVFLPFPQEVQNVLCAKPEVFAN